MRATFFYITLFINILLINAQDFEWATQHGLQPLGENLTYSSVIDSENNVISTGVFDTTIDLDPSANTAIFNSESSDYNIFVQKLDENKNFIWGIRFGGIGNSAYPKKVIVDNNNDIIIVGGFLSRIDLDPNASNSIFSNGNWDGFMAKYSSVDGSLIWGTKIGGTGYDIIKDIAIGNEFRTNNTRNNFVIVGGFSNTVNFNPLGSSLSLTSNGDLDIFAMKYQSSNGNLIFDYTIGGSGKDFANSVDIKDDLPNSQYLENVIFVGQFNSDANGLDFDYSNDDDFIVATYPNYPFITLLDPNFNYLRTSLIDIQDDDSIKDYKISFHNYISLQPVYYLTGNFKGQIFLYNSENGSFQNNYSVNESAFVFKSRMTANNSTNGTSGFTGLNGFYFEAGDDNYFIKPKGIKAIENTIYLIGEYNGNFGAYSDANYVGGLNQSNMQDIFLMSYKSDSNIQQIHTIGGSGNDYVYSIDGFDFEGENGDASTYINYFTISGSFQNTVDFDLSTATNNLIAFGNSDGYTFKFNNEEPTATVFDNELIDLSIYPNPTQNILNFRSDTIINTITIYDIQGREIIKTKPINNQISLKYLNKGIYFLKVDEKIILKKIIKK